MDVKRTFQLVILAALMLGLIVACSSAETVTANAGTDFSVMEGEAPTFDGCESDGPIASYEWRIVEAPAGRETTEGNVIHTDTACSFALVAEMVVDDMGDWVIELSVLDGDGNNAVDTVTVSVIDG